jgi:histidyl-tRNA synthetase
VWFGAGEVKDIRSGEQVAADPDSWTPPEDDLRPSVRGG